MGPHGIVVTPPAFDHDPGLVERVEDFAIEQLIAQPRIEGLDKAVLPRAARRDVGGSRPDSSDPFLHDLGDELRAIVGTNVFGHAAQDEQIREHIDDVDGFQLPVDTNGQTFMGKLVDDVQHSVFLAFMRAILDKVVGPDMVRPLGAKTDTGSVREPKPAALRLFGGNFQPLAPPDPFDPLVVDDPAGGRSQKLRNFPIAVAAILTGELNDVGGQPFFVISPRRYPSLRRTVLSEHTADPSLGQFQLRSNMVNAGSATRGA